MENNIKRKHKYEIQIFEADYEHADSNGGRPEWRPIARGLDNGKPVVIEAADAKELNALRAQYAMCDQRFDIIREIDPFDDPKPDEKAKDEKSDAKSANEASSDASIEKAVEKTIAKDPVVPLDTPKASMPKLKPKIVTIGDVQVKYDGEKIYQRQWVKLNANESINFRVVNDSNNKIVNLAGKHIEARKWVIVEDDNAVDDETSTLDID